MPEYRRNRMPGGTYFFTVNLANRNSDPLTREINPLRTAIRTTRHNRPFHIDAWVVLPDHMHCIWTLPESDVDYSNRWRAIKTHSTKAVSPKNHPSLWQNHFWEQHNPHRARIPSPHGLHPLQPHKDALALALALAPDSAAWP